MQHLRVPLRACLVLCACGLTFTIAGCERPAAPSSVPPERPSSDESTGAPSGQAPLDSIEFSLEPTARGFDQPLLVTHAGDGSGRLFVVEQGGLVRVVRNGSVADEAFLDVRQRITSGGERGLLGLAFAPNYRTSGRFYVNYTDENGDTVIARFIAEDPTSDAPKLEGPQTLLKVEQPYANHNGGHIVFGPDGLLWVGMGDGGAAGDPSDNAQNPRSLLGKMLTLDPDVSAPEPRIVVSGVRNPWRYSFDRETGDLWIADVGQNAWEEIDLLPAGRVEGANLGWNRWEGNHPYPEDAKRDRADFVFPIAEYGHDAGRSVTGGAVYRGSLYPAMRGAYLYADFEAGWIAALRAETTTGSAGTKAVEQRVVIKDAGNPSSFGEDEDGELYVCDLAGGTVYKVIAE